MEIYTFYEKFKSSLIISLKTIIPPILYIQERKFYVSNLFNLIIQQLNKLLQETNLT